MPALTPENSWIAGMAADHIPAPAGWWPPAPGWWIVLALCIAAIILLLRWLRNPHRRLRKLALRELERIEQQQEAPQQVATGIQNVLRRYALSRFGRNRTAKLSGTPWLEFLVTEGAQALAGDAGTNLLAASYGSKVPDMRNTWLMGARQFIRRSGSRRRRKCST